jgi:hypothetical protein
VLEEAGHAGAGVLRGERLDERLALGGERVGEPQ